MADAKTLQELTRVEYWDRRYTAKAETDPVFEWFKDYDNLKPFLEKWLPAPRDGGRWPRVLHAGCGNSKLPIHLLQSSGYKNQVCIDFSSVVINDMAARFAEESKQGIQWLVQDVREMKDLPDQEFDVVIDKATLDAFLSGSLWDPEPDVLQNVGSYINEVARVLKPGGTFLYVTYRQPHFMRPLLKREGVWGLEVETLDGGEGAFEYFGFVMRKV